jgi:hypothetical protein
MCFAFYLNKGFCGNSFIEEDKMETLLMAAVVLVFGGGFMFWALYLMASPGVPETAATKTVWVPVGRFFMEETESSPGTEIRGSHLNLDDHVRREHAAAANFLTVLTPESLHAPIDPTQMD